MRQASPDVVVHLVGCCAYGVFGDQQCVRGEVVEGKAYGMCFIHGFYLSFFARERPEKVRGMPPFGAANVGTVLLSGGLSVHDLCAHFGPPKMP